MKRQIIYFLLVLFFKNAPIYAQNFTEDFEKINKVYTSGIDMTVTYNYYNFYKSAKPDKVINGHVKSYKSMYEITMGDIEIINGKTFKVIADHSGKILTLDSADTKQMSAYYAENTLAELTKNYEKVEYFDKGTSATYKIYSKNGITVYSEITINKTSLIIESIVIYFMDNREDFRKGAIRNKLVINYSNVKTGIKPSESDFSLDKYFLVTNEKYSIKNAYKHYEFLNMISNK